MAKPVENIVVTVKLDDQATEQLRLMIEKLEESKRLMAEIKALAEQPLHCDSCGKTMAEHDALARCWPERGDAR